MVTRDDGNELAGGLIGGASPEPTLAYRALRRVWHLGAALLRFRVQLEGLEQRREVWWGTVPDRVPVTVSGFALEVDILHGQKTGLFLDQRENREAAARYAHGRLLDCFSYNGGFGLALAAKCASVEALDVSADAVARIAENAIGDAVLRVAGRHHRLVDERDVLGPEVALGLCMKRLHAKQRI